MYGIGAFDTKIRKKNRCAALWDLSSAQLEKELTHAPWITLTADPAHAPTNAAEIVNIVAPQ